MKSKCPWLLFVAMLTLSTCACAGIEFGDDKAEATVAGQLTDLVKASFQYPSSPTKTNRNNEG